MSKSCQLFGHTVLLLKKDAIKILSYKDYQTLFDSGFETGLF